MKILRSKELLRSWFGSLDKTVLYTAIFIMLFGWIQIMSVSGAIGYRTSINPLIFSCKQAIFILMGIVIILFFSCLSFRQIAIVSILCSIPLYLLLIWILIFGDVVKGSKRWIYIFNIALQPSDLLKPFFVVLNSIALASRYNLFLSTLLMFITGSLLFFEPDIGMVTIYLFIWLSQSFIANIPLKFYTFIFSSICFIFIAAYTFLPHVHYRINSFYSDDRPYQVKKSIMSMANGGLFGIGLGDGEIKYQLPDVHSDYIFSAIGEEWGLICCIVLLLVYFVFILHSVQKIIWERNDTMRNIGFGIISIFVIHIFMSIGVSTDILPSKGTTLPFISYGGSSIISICISTGILLSLLKGEKKVDNIFERMKRKVFWDILLNNKKKL